MPNRTLTKTENELLFQPLFSSIEERLKKTCGDDEQLIWALRRKLAKKLVYQERGTPMHRRKIKTQKRAEQNNLCAICGKPLPETDAILDRVEAMSGYTLTNTRLIHRVCDFQTQTDRNFS